MLLLVGYVPATCHKNNIVTLLVTSMLYYRNITFLLGKLVKSGYIYLCEVGRITWTF